MFVQIMTGKPADAVGLRRQWDEWMAHVAPGAIGWLGATGGVSSQGDAVIVARFESEEAARANSDRAEQGEWWAETEKYFEGPVEFYESADVTDFWGGGSDAAGFVQLMRATCSNRDRLEELEGESDALLREHRPDVLGGLRVWNAPTVVAVDYFTSEAEARAGEQREMPDAMKAVWEEWGSLLSDMTWFDITEPWLAGPG